MHVKHHNQQAALPGRPNRLLPIENPNLIYVGQIIMVPPRTPQSMPGTGLRRDADQIAQGVDTRVVYKLEGPENQYRRVLPNCIIEARLTGTIAIENVMHDRYEHNLELSLDKHGIETKHNLGRFSDHAFRDLTRGVALDFDSGRVTIQAPIMYKAGLGPFTIEVQAESTIHHEFSSILLKKHTLLLNPWLGQNPAGFEYLSKIEKDVLAIYESTNREGTEEDYENGFMNSYGRTDFENDFNEYNAMIFTYPHKFKAILARYPRVRAKFRVWLDFYHSIDPIFTEGYLLGAS